MDKLTVTDAYRAFSNAADELRHKYMIQFGGRLRVLHSKENGLSRPGLLELISVTRREFSNEYADKIAPPLFRKLSPSSSHDCIQNLKVFDATAGLTSEVELQVPSPTWRPGIVRTCLGTSYGVLAAALLLFAATNINYQGSSPNSTSEFTAPVPAPASPAGNHDSSTPSPVGTKQSSDKTPASSTSSKVSSASDVRWLVVAVLVAATGAGLGALAVLIPPLRLVMTDKSGVLYPVAVLLKFKPIGLIFAFFTRRQLTLITALLAVILVAFVFLALFVGNAGYIPFFAATILGVALARMPNRDRDQKTSESLQSAGISALRSQLVVEGARLSGLASGMILRAPDPTPPPESLDKLRETVVMRLSQGQTQEDVWAIVKQYLKLDGSSFEKDDAEESEWQLELSELYDCVGIVDVGDPIVVLRPPLRERRPNGIVTIVKKGEVARKR